MNQISSQRYRGVLSRDQREVNLLVHHCAHALCFKEGKCNVISSGLNSVTQTLFHKLLQFFKRNRATLQFGHFVEKFVTFLPIFIDVNSS